MMVQFMHLVNRTPNRTKSSILTQTPNGLENRPSTAPVSSYLKGSYDGNVTKDGESDVNQSQLSPSANPNVNVYVRIRPFNTKEDQKQFLDLDPTCSSIRVQGSLFSVDGVFEQDRDQADVFNATARSIVETCLTGYNGTILAYGQTGSGKTYTMNGKELDSNSSNRGLIPRCLEYLFECIERDTDKTYTVTCSYLEIYTNKVYDLLHQVEKGFNCASRPELTVLNNGTHVKNLTQVSIASPLSALEILARGVKRRSVAQTNMNNVSSRSHSIFTVNITQTVQNRNKTRTTRASKLQLVDLAGSESTKNTGVSRHDAVKFQESASINQSLMTLGQLIRGEQAATRSYKLTQLLHSSIGSGHKMCVITNISPSSDQQTQTLATLNFASAATRLTNKMTLAPTQTNGDNGTAMTELQERSFFEMMMKFSDLRSNQVSLVDELSTQLSYFKEQLSNIKREMQLDDTKDPKMDQELALLLEKCDHYLSEPVESRKRLSSESSISFNLNDSGCELNNSKSRKLSISDDVHTSNMIELRPDFNLDDSIQELVREQQRIDGGLLKKDDYNEDWNNNIPPDTTNSYVYLCGDSLQDE